MPRCDVIALVEFATLCEWRFTVSEFRGNPRLDISEVPAGTKSLVLIMDDPDAPMGTWDHWILFNIPIVSTIPEGGIPEGAVQGRNSWGNSEWGGPCPPSGKHRYVFRLYALNDKLELDHHATKNDVHKAMSGKVISQAQITGLYEKT